MKDTHSKRMRLRAVPAVRAAVRAAFFAFTSPLDGVVPHMYADVLNYVTCAIGNLIDPMGAAFSAPWMVNGSAATREEIAADWAKVKQTNCGNFGYEAYVDPKDGKTKQRLRPCLFKGTGKSCMPHQGWRAASLITRCRLTDEGVEQVVLAKLDANDALLAKRFPNWEDFPADAQLATHSMAWACGAAFRYPRLERLLKESDFASAATECTINPQDATIRVRNAANALMYRAAAYVQGAHLDYDELLLDLPSVKRAVDTLYDPDPAKRAKPTTRIALEQDEIPTSPELPDAPVSEDDGGADRRAATLDIASELSRHRGD